jgi:hypothetical protein
MAQQQNHYLSNARAKGKGPVVKEGYGHNYSTATCSKPF